MPALATEPRTEWLAEFSRHAARRVRQRGLRDRDVELVIACGTPVAGEGIVLLIRDVEREIARRKREIQALERLRGYKVVLADGMIVTCYRTCSRREPRHAHRIQAGKGGAADGG